MKKQTINALLVGAMIFGTVMLQSCSSQSETTETTVTKSVASTPIDTANDTSTQPPASTTTTTTTTKSSSDEHPGVLSSAMDTVGAVVALPFRIVGDTFEAIF